MEANIESSFRGDVNSQESKDVNVLEIADRIEALKSQFSNSRDKAERDKIIEESRKLSALEIAHAKTYEEFLEAHFHSLHPEDRKVTYMKMIKTAPSRDIVQQLFYHAADEEIKEAARQKLDDFKE
jgi:hypothetical protein